jgi:hypothetical protein
MIYYLLLPLFSVLLLALQTSLFDLLFLGKIGVEVSLVVVVYAGFKLDMAKGGLLSFVLGFFLDCITSVVPGLFVFIYLFIFFISKIASFRIYAEGILFVMGFTFLCALSEGVIIVAVYKTLYGINIFHDMSSIFLPQALVVGIISPALFSLFNRLEVFINAGETKSSDRL